MEEEKEKFDQVELTDEEKKQAQFNLDSVQINLKTAEFDVEQMEEQIKLRLPQRQAELNALEAVRKKKMDIDRYKHQKKDYEFRVRTGKKKVPKAVSPVEVPALE